MLIRTRQTGGSGAELVFDLELCSVGICPVSNCLDGISSGEEERESAIPTPPPPAAGMGGSMCSGARGK